MDGRIGARWRPAIIGGQGGGSPQKWTERRSTAESSDGGYERVGAEPLHDHPGLDFCHGQQTKDRSRSC
jgi:hypothetical protein